MFVLFAAVIMFALACILSRVVIALLHPAHRLDMFECHSDERNRQTDVMNVLMKWRVYDCASLFMHSPPCIYSVFPFYNAFTVFYY